jgi:hypothetical protein
MQRVLWIVALGASACAKPSQPVFADPLVVVSHGTDDIVDVHQAEEIPGYVVTFGKAKGFPTSLSFVGQELLGAGTTCDLESLIGTAIYPAAVAVGDIALDPASTLTFDLEGPAVARAKVSYAVPYTCNGAAQHLSGTTTLTFFPFGRIARHDEVTASDSALPASPNCECASDNNYFFTSFWTFAPQATALMPTGATIDETNDYDQQTACFTYSALGAYVGIRYSGTQTRVILTQGEELSRFVNDFQRRAPSLGIGERGSVDSAIQLSDTEPQPCSQLTEPLEDRGLRVDGRAAVLDGSGIFTDPGGDYGRTIAITGAGAIAPGFVVSLSGIHEHLKVNRENTEETYYLPQLDRAGGRTLVWFRDALLAGTTAEIELLE